MRKLCGTILASLLFAFVVVGTTQDGSFGGKLQIAECWRYCLFIDPDLAIADKLLRSDFAGHYGFARALAPGEDSVVGVEPVRPVPPESPSSR